MSNVNNPSYIKSLNGLRGYAFLCVYIEHLLLYNSILLSIAQPAISLFFVLSAYLLVSQLYHKLYKNSRLDLANYFIRRIFRIYPCFIVSVLLDLFLSQRLEITDSIFVLTNIKPLLQYWTIYVEFRVYLLFPIITYLIYKLWGLNKTIVKALSVFLILGFLCLHIYITFFTLYNMRESPQKANEGLLSNNILFLNYLPVFIVGVTLAIFCYENKNKDKNESDLLIKNEIVRGIIAAMLVFSNFILILIIGLYSLYKGYVPNLNVTIDNFGLFFSFAYSCSILLLIKGNNFMIRLFESEVLQFIGNISYPAFLIHLIMFSFIKNNIVSPDSNKALFILFSTIFSFICAYIIHFTIEKTCIDKTKNWLLEEKKEEGYISANIPIINENSLEQPNEKV